MAKEVSSGSITRMMQMENTLQRERAEKTTAELEANLVFSTAEQRVDALESYAERIKNEYDENARLLSGSVNAVLSLEQDCESLRQASASLNEELVNYQRAHYALQQTLRDSNQECEVMKGKLHTMEACIAAGPKYSTPMLERDTLLREEIAQMKEKEN
ncbi:MAG: hypothetical protein ACKPKO_29100, partial [Candidatus Fonsibacter sp.]